MCTTLREKNSKSTNKNVTDQNKKRKYIWKNIIHFPGGKHKLTEVVFNWFPDSQNYIKTIIKIEFCFWITVLAWFEIEMKKYVEKELMSVGAVRVN